jgi:Bacterial SH3 domain
MRGAAARALATPLLTALAALALLPGAAARAEEPLYVIEQLVVNVNSAPGSAGERVATLKSGDRVELIERQGDEVHVRLANGRDGWVRASYFTTAEPLRVQLAARTAEVTQLKSELERLQAQQRTQTAAAAAAAAPGAAHTVPASLPTGGAADATQVRGALLDAAPVIYRPRWRWVALSAFLSLLVGFALGWFVLDRRIRARYGGLRIY